MLGLSGDRARGDAPNADGWNRVMAEARRITVTAERAEINGGRLTGLTLRGAWVLTSDLVFFGGYSGLFVSEGKLIALSDTHGWFGASLIQERDDLRIEDARLGKLKDSEGRRYTKARGDAEGLTRLGSRLVVTFERDNRLMFLGETGLMGDAIRSGDFDKLESNKGLEALASVPDGRMIAFSEGKDDLGVPVFLINPSGEVTVSHLPSVGVHAVTGADVGPDGRLYLVLRDYSFIYGLSIRVMRYHLGVDCLPIPESAETLAEFENASGIDNMEGISLERAPDGGIRLWLISDNNFQFFQRTLLMEFDVLP
jgi:hypothetical protein